nr:MAG TPA: hypothetical protein [Caudoviricetes sp.]
MGRRLNLSPCVSVRRAVAARVPRGLSVRVAASSAAARSALFVSPRLSYIRRYGQHTMLVVLKILDKEPKSHPKGKTILE